MRLVTLLMDNTEHVSSFDGSTIEQLAGECPFCGGVLVLADEIGVTVAIGILYMAGQRAISSLANI